MEISDEFPSKQDQPKSDPPDNPTKGIIFYLLHGLIFQFNFIFAKILYERNASLTQFQLLFYRSVISTVIMVGLVNKDLKKTVYDSVNKDNFRPLLLRVI